MESFLRPESYRAAWMDDGLIKLHWCRASLWAQLLIAGFFSGPLAKCKKVAFASTYQA